MAKAILKSTGQQVIYETDSDVEIFYDTGSDELGIITKEQMPGLKKEIDWMDAFKPYLKPFLVHKEGDSFELRDAKVQAVMHVMKDFVDAKDESKSQAIISNLDTLIKKKVDEILKDPDAYKVNLEGHKMKAGDVREVYWVKGKRMVRIRDEKKKAYNKWANRRQVKNALRKEQKDNEAKQAENKGKVATEAELKIFERKLFKNQEGALTKEIEEFNKKCNVKFFEDSDMIDCSAGAQFLRYAAEGAYGGSFKWTDEISMKVEGKCEGSFALAQAQGSFSLSLPDKYGFGLMQYFKKEHPKYIKDDFTEIFVRVGLTTRGSAFVGACAAVSLDLGLTVTEAKKKKEPKSLQPKRVIEKQKSKNVEFGAQAGVELFAGAKAQAEASISMDMMLVDDKQLDLAREVMKTVGERGDQTISSKNLGDFVSLADVTFGGYASAGLGIDAVLRAGYIDGAIRFIAKIGATLKIGAGTFLKGTVNAELIGKFIFTVAHGVNWINLSKAFDDTAQALLHSVMSNCFYLGREVNEVYNELYEVVKDKFEDFLEFVTDLDGFAAKGFNEIKIIDDQLDQALPGYSSFKQYSNAFIILRDSYHYFKNIDEKEKAIQAVLNAESDKKRWNYATWQMKVNLIYDMRHQDESWFDKFSKKDRGEAVLSVLSSARHKVEFEKIIKNLEDPDSEGFPREAIKLDNLLSNFTQQKTYTLLKLNYK